MTILQTWRRGRRPLLAAALATLVALLFVGTASAAQVTLSPASSTLVIGQSVTLTASLTNPPQPDEPMTFTIKSGPNAGKQFSTTTDANGQATFTYSSSQTGADVVSATALRFETTSNDATVTWNAPPPPEPAKSDVQLTLTSVPSTARVGENASWTASMTNAGPDTATGVSVQTTGPAGATLVSATASRGNGCTGATCAIGTLSAGASATVTLVYKLGQAGSLTLTASVQSDFDTNTSNNSASATTVVLEPDQPPPPPPPPAQPGTFNAIPTGTVLVDGAAQPADQLFVVHSGDTIDVTDGIITMTLADGSTGSFSASQPTARRSLAARGASLSAAFTIEQPSSGGVPTLALAGGDFSACSSSRNLSINRKPVRGLWGSAKGNFVTKSRYSSATVRGTIWFVEDRCDGSLTQVVQGVVSVFDAARKKTVTVNAGGSYLAAPRPPLKLPAQSAAKVAKRGLIYGARVYKTKAAFTQRLKSIGYTWADFARKYPKVAAALARRH